MRLPTALLSVWLCCWLVVSAPAQPAAGPADELATIQSRLVALAAQGDLAGATRMAERALEANERQFGRDSHQAASASTDLAIFLECLGQYEQAEKLLERALAINEKNSGPENIATANSLFNLAEINQRQGRLATARPIYDRAATAFDKLLSGIDPDFGETEVTAEWLEMLALIHERRDQPSQSEPLLQRALKIREAWWRSENPSMSLPLSRLAALYARQGRSVEAKAAYTRALKLFPRDHPFAAELLHDLARLEAATGDIGEATTFFDLGRGATRRHVTSVLPTLSAPEQTAFLEAKDKNQLHSALSLCLLPAADRWTCSRAAGWLANAKAVGQEAASQQIILARQSGNPAVADLQRVRGDLATLAQTTPLPEQSRAHQQQLAELQAKEQRLVHAIGGQLATLRRDDRWIDIDQIRRNIPAGSVFVDIARFNVYDFAAMSADARWRPARYGAWVVPRAGKGDVSFLDLGPADQLDAAVADYRAAIDAVARRGFSRGQAQAEDELKITAAPLSQRVLQPIVETIDGATEIILSPDGVLWLVPWHALPLADGAYAIERYSIPTVTSGRDLVPSAAPPPAATETLRGPLVVADPAFDAVPPSSGTSGDRTTRAFASAGTSLGQATRLPATLAEARASALALGTIFSREPQQLTGTAATEENVKREAVRPSALVLATHGFFLPDQVAARVAPTGLGDAATGLAGTQTRGTRAVTATGEPVEDPLLRCGLLLAGANQTAAGRTLPGDDGILTGAEIVGLDLLGTNLVVLSACQTGEGKVNTGEGVAGLRQAFQIAGAKSVVATLWQVPDMESGLIMQSFYANVAKGQPPPKALREAQLAFIRERRADRAAGEAAHPFLWAAYGVTGRFDAPLIDPLPAQPRQMRTLSAEQAQVLASRSDPLELDDVTSLSDEAAEALSHHDGELSLGALTRLSDRQAEALGRHTGSVFLGGLTTLSDSQAKALARLDGERYGGTLALVALPTISDRQADVLARRRGNLILNGLTTLSDRQADAFGGHRGGLGLRGLTALSDRQAKALAGHEGGLSIQLSMLSETAVRELARCKGPLMLGGLTELTDAQAAALGAHQGELFLNDLVALSSTQAESLARHDGGLFLNGLGALSDAQAQALGNCKAPLGLSGVTRLSDGQAEAFARREGDLILSGVRELSDRQAESLGSRAGDLYLNGLTALTDGQAAALARHRGNLFLNRVRELSDSQADALAGHKGVLDLGGVTALTDGQAAALARHDGTLSLTGVRTMSDKAFATLRSADRILLPRDGLPR